jgi:hypothetical protein
LVFFFSSPSLLLSFVWLRSEDRPVIMAPISAPRTAFSEALDEFLLSFKDDNKTKSPFQKEVLAVKQNGNPETCAKSLMDFVNELARKRKDSRSMEIVKRLDPLISGLKYLMSACELVSQSNPSAVGVVFTGARVVLEVS